MGTLSVIAITVKHVCYHDEEESVVGLYAAGEEAGLLTHCVQQLFGCLQILSITHYTLLIHC